MRELQVKGVSSGLGGANSKEKVNGSFHILWEIVMSILKKNGKH